MVTPPVVGDPGASWDRETWKSRTEVELKQEKSASVVDRDDTAPALVDVASRSEVELKRSMGRVPSAPHYRVRTVSAQGRLQSEGSSIANVCVHEHGLAYQVQHEQQEQHEQKPDPGASWDKLG
jgi:hypothetical protein